MSDSSSKYLRTKDFAKYWHVSERHARRRLRGKRFNRWRIGRRQGQHGRFAQNLGLAWELSKGGSQREIRERKLAQLDKWFERFYFDSAARVDPADDESKELFVAITRNIVAIFDEFDREFKQAKLDRRKPDLASIVREWTADPDAWTISKPGKLPITAAEDILEDWQAICEKDEKVCRVDAR